MNFKSEFPCPPNRREYSRVKAVVPFGARLVPPEERESLLSRVSNQTAVELGGLPEVQDQALAEWLSMINRKLDLLLNTLGAQKQGFNSLPVRQINTRSPRARRSAPLRRSCRGRIPGSRPWAHPPPPTAP